MMRLSFKDLGVAVALLTSLPQPVLGQALDQALRLYKGDELGEAAFAFYDVLQHDADAQSRDQAEIYLAESLKKLGLYFPALFYYSDIFKAGRSTRYYLNAAGGLLELQNQLHDPLFVPTLINVSFDAEAFAQLGPEAIAQINYLIGELSVRQGRSDDARAFLEYVSSTSPLYGKARYLLGIVAVKKGDSEAAKSRFVEVVEHIGETTSDVEDANVRRMALLALGRSSYGEGKYVEASSYYGQIPRFSEQWFDAMYENAWARFQAQEYGLALGELQSVTSPYFNKRLIPEAYVVQGTAYFVNCQWDRVRSAVKTYREAYGPKYAALHKYLGEDHDPRAVYRALVKGGAGAYPEEVARQVRRQKRFRDYHFMLEHLRWERAAITQTAVWDGSRLREDLLSIVDQNIDQLEPAVGGWARQQLQQVEAELRNFTSQIDILDFEVADAERNWLEQGKEILKGRRARLPRPEVPNDQWQHWNFEREYWKDELGYYAHTVSSECE